MNKKLLIILILVLLVILISFFIFLNKTKNSEIQNVNSIKKQNQEDGRYNTYNKKEKTDISVGSNTSLCENACANYVLKCMNLDPNLKPELIADSVNECMKECAKWDDKKKNCILEAIDCESMTDVCGL